MSIKVINDGDGYYSVRNKINDNFNEVYSPGNPPPSSDAGSNEFNAHVNNMQNPHSTTKTQIGLSNVDNTSDMDKPVSNLQQKALDSKLGLNAKAADSALLNGLTVEELAVSDATKAETVRRLPDLTIPPALQSIGSYINSLGNFSFEQYISVAASANITDIPRTTAFYLKVIRMTGLARLFVTISYIDRGYMLYRRERGWENADAWTGGWEYFTDSPNPNIFINGDFTNPVNTRGLTEYSVVGRIINGWEIILSQYKVSVLSGFLRVERYTGTGLGAIRQYLNKRISGTTLTCSIKYKTSNVNMWRFRVGLDGEYNVTSVYFPASSDDYSIYSFTFTVPSDQYFSALNIWGRDTLPVGGYIDIESVKFEMGQISTLDNDPPANYNQQFLLSTGASPTQSNYNILHNWDFTNPVNQRGLTEYNGANIYTIDRWRTGASYTNASVSIMNDFIRISVPTTNIAAFTQIIEFPDRYLNIPLTLSVLTMEGLFSNSFTITGNGVFGNIDLVNNVRASVNKDNQGLYVRIQGNTTVSDNTFIDIVAMKLEIGSVSTLANDPPMDYGKELAVCQRYQLIIPQHFITKDVRVHPNYIDFLIPTSSLRINPSISISNYDINGFSDFSLTSAVRFSNSVLIRATKTGHGLNSPCTFVVGTGSGLFFDANL